MDKKTTLEMIAAISNANGTSGFEDEVVAAIRPYAEGLANKYRTTRSDLSRKPVRDSNGTKQKW